MNDSSRPYPPYSRHEPGELAACCPDHTRCGSLWATVILRVGRDVSRGVSQSFAHVSRKFRTFRAGRHARFAHDSRRFAPFTQGGVTIGSGVSEGRRWSGLRPQRLKLAENVGKWVVIISGGLRGIFEGSKCNREEIRGREGGEPVCGRCVSRTFRARFAHVSRTFHARFARFAQGITHISRVFRACFAGITHCESV